MSRVCGNKEDSGEHRFHGLEHDSKIRFFKTHPHTSTLRSYEAYGKMTKQKTKSGKRKTGNGLQRTQRKWRHRRTLKSLLSSGLRWE